MIPAKGDLVTVHGTPFPLYSRSPDVTWNIDGRVWWVHDDGTLTIDRGGWAPRASAQFVRLTPSVWHPLSIRRCHTPCLQRKVA